MTSVEVRLPFGTFRKSYARSLGETYDFVPPATAYAFLLSLVGETKKRRHVGVRLGFAYSERPGVSQTFHNLDLRKYSGKAATAPDFVESLTNVNFIVWLDSLDEVRSPTLEDRVNTAISEPAKINRFGCLSLGLSDNIVELVKIARDDKPRWRLLKPEETGESDLTIWVDQAHSENTLFGRFNLDTNKRLASEVPPAEMFVSIQPVKPTS